MVRAAEKGDRPLLALVMIVKDEARGIRDTLASAQPHVDHFTVLDTGSTDGTQELVRDTMGDTPGEVYEEPFVDFGTSRSRVLDLAGEATVFTLMLSGDEKLVGGAALRAFCEERRDASEGAYHLRIEYGGAVYDSARLARTSAGWRYVGVTHEVLAKEGMPPPGMRVPGVHVVHEIRHTEPSAPKRRWELDRELLEAEAQRDPTSTRIAFYLAQTLECLDLHDRAYEAYARRVALGGWQEEVYESLFRMARTAHARGTPWPVVQQLYLDAHAHSRERAEPLYAIAHHWYEKRNWPLTFLFASRGAAIPFPTSATLFVDPDVYEYKLLDLVGASAFYVGEFGAGRAALEKALEKRPGDARLLDDLAFYHGK